MADNKTILFISETAPVNTHASSVVFYRHFSLLEREGYRIIWITDENSYKRSGTHRPKSWEVVLLPNRKWMLPPYRPFGWLQAWRFGYYYRQYVDPVIARTPGAVILTHLSGQFLAPFSAYVREKSKLPLLSFFHDDIVELNFNKDKQPLIANALKVLKASSQVAAVSDALSANWPAYAHKFRLLLPIPAPYQLQSAEKKAPPLPLTFGYAGAVYQETLPYFRRLAAVFQELGHRLVIVGDLSKTKTLAETYPDTVFCHDLFDSPAGAAALLTGLCHAALVLYPDQVSEMPWIATCFPSKFLQYCQLELPTLIIAPRTSAIGQWCTARRWPLYADNYERETIAGLVEATGLPGVAEAVLGLKTGEFAPDHIQQQFRKLIDQPDDAR